VHSFYCPVCMPDSWVSAFMAEVDTEKDLVMRWKVLCKTSGQSYNFGTEISVLIVSFIRLDVNVLKAFFCSTVIVQCHYLCLRK
jgi:hypothetical protein